MSFPCRFINKTKISVAHVFFDLNLQLGRELVSTRWLFHWVRCYSPFTFFLTESSQVDREVRRTSISAWGWDRASSAPLCVRRWLQLWLHSRHRALAHFPRPFPEGIKLLCDPVIYHTSGPLIWDNASATFRIGFLIHSSPAFMMRIAKQVTIFEE
jgi:hypothetical protein